MPATIAPTQDAVSECGVPIRNLWHMLMYAWDQAAVRDRWRVEVEDAPTLDALLARVLMRLAQQRIRIGLGRNYTEETRRLQGVRGRIDFGASAKGLTFLKQQAVCRFDEFSANVPKNQIVRSTLHRISQVGVLGPGGGAIALRQELRRLVRDLEGIDLIEVNLDVVRRHSLGRNDGDYHLMLTIWELLLRRHMPTESAGKTSLPGMDRDELTLHQVFETFVARFYQLRLRSWTVRPQAHLDWNATQTSAYLPKMKADLVLEHTASGRIVVLDTKFTPGSLKAGQHNGKLTFDSGHIYQVYAYLRSQEARSPAHQSAAGMLLYPTVKHHLSETIELQGHVMHWRTIDLSQQWKQVEADLLALMAHQTT